MLIVSGVHCDICDRSGSKNSCAWPVYIPQRQMELLRHRHRFLKLNRIGLIKRQRPVYSALISTGMG